MIDLKDIEKIKITKDDVLIITFTEEVPLSVRDTYMDRFHRIFPENSFIFKDPNITIEVISKASHPL